MWTSLGIMDRIEKRATASIKRCKQLKEEHLARCRKQKGNLARLAILIEEQGFIKEKRWIEGREVKLNKLISNIEEKLIKEAYQPVSDLVEATIELNGMMKNVQCDMRGLVSASNEILVSLGRSHSMGGTAADKVEPSNLQPKNELDDLN